MLFCYAKNILKQRGKQMNKFKQFFADFKKFISRGNIIDMAVGVIVGSAFSAIVKALTDKIIMPLINALLAGGNGLESAYTMLVPAYSDEAKTIIDYGNSIYIDWGAFITAILNFLIIAFTLFIVLKVAMKSREMFEQAAKIVKPKLTKEQKKELKSRGIKLSNKEAVNAYLVEVAAKEAEAKALAEAEAMAKAEAEKLANPSQEELLKQIRDLLAEKNKPSTEQ